MKNRMVQDDKPLVLVIEDDTLGAQRIQLGLEVNHFRAELAGSLKEARAFLSDHHPDLVVIDIHLPDGQGYSLIEQLRSAGVGILCISAAGELDDRVNALSLGADDYLVKPIATTELALKLTNLHQRIKEQKQKQKQKQNKTRTYLKFMDFVCDADAQRVSRDDVVVDLTPGEFQLLQHFLNHPKTALGRERLIQMLASEEKDINDRAIDIAVHKIRQKIESDPKDPKLLKTVYGVGYIFDCDVIAQHV